MHVVCGCRLSSAFIGARKVGFAPGFGNGVSMSQWSSTSRPTSAARSKMRSIAGSFRLGTSVPSLDDTNSLWMVNSPMPVNTPGNVSSTRRMWSAAYMSAGLKPVIIGSSRACSG